MEEKLKKFHDAVQSLKLYRRAELPGQEDNAEVVKKLYVDPLPNDYIFETVLRPNTTFIIGILHITVAIQKCKVALLQIDLFCVFPPLIYGVAAQVENVTLVVHFDDIRA
ncbi:MAG: hypothetical protein OQL17_09910 [Sedimenticola sp.]|nr:hypothetical protein [Sedimenticola sp.]